jgi:hypothetical protein
LKQRAHPLVNDVDRLQMPEHHLELDDLAGLVPLDQVDAVDEDAVDLGLAARGRARTQCL